MYLELDRLSKQFDGKYAVHDLSLGLEEGGLLCILGSSGCGKTTTLNMIGGFLKPDGGRVLLDGQDITALPPERRPVSTVFQSYGLFPHMSVLQNVTYGLKFRGYSRAEAKEKGRRYLSLVGLAERENARIGELSGGQQQRVALARALIVEPKLCLLDEPLSNLDAALRVRMRGELKTLAARARHHDGLRHTRSGGGAHSGRLHRRDERGRALAARLGRGGLPPSCKRLYRVISGSQRHCVEG